MFRTAQQLLFAATVTSCQHAAAPGKTEPTEVILLPSGHEIRVHVEVARTEGERNRGLMYRQKLDVGQGMLFLFDRPQGLKFWMHNTYIPLDMIFISNKMRVVFVEQNADPLTDTARGPDVDTQYVLEVPGGWSQKIGVEPGTEVRFIGVNVP